MKYQNWLTSLVTFKKYKYQLYVTVHFSFPNSAPKGERTCIHLFACDCALFLWSTWRDCIQIATQDKIKHWHNHETGDNFLFEWGNLLTILSVVIKCPKRQNGTCWKTVLKQHAARKRSYTMFTLPIEACKALNTIYNMQRFLQTTETNTCWCMRIFNL